MVRLMDVVEPQRQVLRAVQQLLRNDHFYIRPAKPAIQCQQWAVLMFGQGVGKAIAQVQRVAQAHGSSAGL